MAPTLATWTIDPVHSSAEFSLDYMGFSTYRTGFRALEGSLEFHAARPCSSSVNASIPAASVNVTNDRLMSRLMDPDLLGGRDHPTISFKSTSRRGSRPGALEGDACDPTIHGVAQPVVLDTVILGQGEHPFSGKMAAAFRGGDAVRPARLRGDLERGHGHGRRVPRRARGRSRSPSWPFARTDREEEHPAPLTNFFLRSLMIVIAQWVPYPTGRRGSAWRQFMELQAVFALVILCGEVPSGLLSDLW